MARQDESPAPRASERTFRIAHEKRAIRLRRSDSDDPVEAAERPVRSEYVSSRKAACIHGVEEGTCTKCEEDLF